MANNDLLIQIKTAFESGPMMKGINDINKSLNVVDKKLEDTSKASHNMSNSFKNTLSVMKGFLGAQAVTKGLEMLGDAFMKNEKVATMFNTVITTIEIVFSKVVKAIIDTVEQVSKSSNGFEHLGKVMKGMLTLVLTPFELTWFEIKLAIDGAQLAWEKSVFGSGDTKKIAELEKSLTETANKIVDIGKDAITAGADIVNNIGGAIGEVGDVVEGATKKIKETVKVGGAFNLADRFEAAKKAATEMKPILQKQITLLETQAEKLRQTRDNELESLDVRREAGKNLVKTLDDIEVVKKRQVGLDMTVAKIDNQINTTAEKRAKITDLNNQILDVANQKTQQLSENKQSLNQLELTGIAIANDKMVTDAEVAKISRETTASIIDDDTKRLNVELTNLQISKEEQIKVLDDKIKSYKKGTPAYAEAENEKAKYIISADQQIAAKQKEIRDNNIVQENRANQAIIDSNTNRITELQNKLKEDNATTISERLKALTEINRLTNENLTKQRDIELNNVKLTEKEKANIRKKYDTEIAENSRKTFQTKISSALEEVQKYGQAFGALVNMLSSFNDIENQRDEQMVKRIEKEIQGIEEVKNKQLQAVEDSSLSEQEKYNKKVEIEKASYDLEMQKFAMMEEIKKKEFERNKKYQIANAVIATAMAVTSGLATQPFFPLGIAMGAFALATGIAQIQKIKEQQYEGGNAPTMQSFSPPKTDSGAPSAGASTDIGKSKLNLSPDSLKYQKVYVEQSDIRSVIGRVETIEGRNKIR